MFNHSFILSPGNWFGEGKITLNMVEEELIFNTNWAIQNKDFAGKVSCAQDIQVQGLSENMRNELTFYDFQPKTFSVDMENADKKQSCLNAGMDDAIQPQELYLFLERHIKAEQDRG